MLVSNNSQRHGLRGPGGPSAKADAGKFDVILSQSAEVPKEPAGLSGSSDVIRSERSNPSKPNFKNMSPSEFRAEAKAMYDRGEVDIATLGPMVLRTYAQDEGSDDFGSVGSGKFDYIEIFEATMNSVSNSGKRYDPTSGYLTYESIIRRMA